MKRNYLLLVLAIVGLFVLSSCGGSKIVEVVINQYDDGKPKDVSVYEIISGDSILLMDRKFHPNGEKYIEGSYKDGRRFGTWTSWYPNGLVWSSCSYIDGKEDGVYTTFHENGMPYIEGQYSNGKEVGVWRFSSETGELLTSHDFDTNTTTNHAQQSEPQTEE